MKIVISGLTTGIPEDTAHGTRWRALAAALAGRGHRVVVLDRLAVPETAGIESGGSSNLERVSYTDWDRIAVEAARHADESALSIVIAHGRDALAAADLILNSRAAQKVIYDPDTPATLARLVAGEPAGTLPLQGLAGFDLLLGSTGGQLLESLRIRTDAPQAAPLYPWIVPSLHRPPDSKKEFLGDLCCLVPNAAAMRVGLEGLFLEPAQRLARRRFVVAGPDLPEAVTRAANVLVFENIPLTERAAFFASSTLTLSLVRDDCRASGWCPPPRLLEAAACGVPIVSDRWDGLETFFDPGREILAAAQSDDVTTALMLPRNHLMDLGRRARQRVLAEHTAERRVQELRTLFDLRGGGGDD